MSFAETPVWIKGQSSLSHISKLYFILPFVMSVPKCWFYQDTGPPPLHLKEQGVGISDQIIRAGFDEESVSEL